MRKFRFVIVGSGWRSLYYVRIAKALPQRFELCAMLCRTQEKARKMAAEHGIYATTSIEECRDMNPDFVVIAVTKASIFTVSAQWLDYGFCVLCETPAALQLTELEKLWHFHKQGKKIVVAEQYAYYPMYQAILQVLRENIIGSPYNINLSLAHDYHGASLMRAFLNLDLQTPFQVSGKSYHFPTVETLNRYERFRDGRVADKARTVATFEFADGKVAWYDFNSEQYRSPIRRNHLKIEGSKGQLLDDTIYFLDDTFSERRGSFQVTERYHITDDSNPNLHRITEVEEILFHVTMQDESGTIRKLRESSVYHSPFGSCALSQDETALATLMLETGKYATAASTEICNRGATALACALQDAYMSILLQKAVSTGNQITSEEQIWQ